MNLVVGTKVGLLKRWTGGLLIVPLALCVSVCLPQNLPVTRVVDQLMEQKASKVRHK